nr:hypothetical protein BaRGS_001997 [Batillaria attramentaria]
MNGRSNEYPVKDCVQYLVKDCVQYPVKDCVQYLVKDCVQCPVKDCVQYPVKDCVQYLVKDYVQYLVKDYVQYLVKDCVQSLVKDCVQCLVKDCVQYLVKDCVQYLVKDCVQYLVKDCVQYLVKDCVQEPVKDCVQYLVKDCVQYLVKDCVQYPFRDCVQYLVFQWICSFPMVSECRRKCPFGWQRFKKSCYGIGDSRVTWAEAQQICESFGGTLAEINSAEENEFLKNEARSRNYLGLWLGGTDMFSEGQFTWAGSKRLMSNGRGFTDWGPGQPDDHGSHEDCIHLWRDIDYRWNDVPCFDWRLNFACEKKLKE